VSANQRDDGASAASALASGLAAASWVMAVISLVGVAMAVVFIRRFRPGQGKGTMEDVLAAAASVVHTVPPAATTSLASEGVEAPGGTAVPQAPPATPGRG